MAEWSVSSMCSKFCFTFPATINITRVTLLGSRHTDNMFIR